MLVLTVDDKNAVEVTNEKSGEKFTMTFNRKKGGKSVSVGFSEPDGQRNFNIARKKQAAHPAGNN